MTGQKHTGSFYTPTLIAKFIVERVVNKIKLKDFSVLEPSVGDGVFIKEILLNRKISKKNIDITAVEIVEEEFHKVANITTPPNIFLDVIHNDFLRFQQNTNKKYDLIIGNPPYIKRTLLSEEQSNLCSEITNSYAVKNASVKNIWSSFLLASFKLINDKGIIALILPSELLQVSYAEVLRNYLLENFERVEIFTFSNLVFKSCKGQDTIILIAEKKAKEKGLFFFNIDDINEQPSITNSVKHDTSSQLKWTSHVLDIEEIELIENLSAQLKKISDFCTSKTGIVTAANDFFIINEKKVKELKIKKKFYKPILSKSSNLPKGILFNSDDLKQLIQQEVPSYLLDLNTKEKLFNEELQEYISYGERIFLHQRYKMLKRFFWYQVPNIGTYSPVLFFKRCHNFPRIILNNANVLATDSAYLVNPHENINPDSLVYSFYNSLTLAMAEIQGRSYGGGVLELTPSEFKSLPLPYLFHAKEDILILNELFKNESDISIILEKNDHILLKHYFPEITECTLNKIKIIREKLVTRRQRL